MRSTSSERLAISFLGLQNCKRLLKFLTDFVTAFRAKASCREVGMRWFGCIRGLRSARRGAYLLAVATVCSGAFPQQTLAAQVQAYIVFEIGASSDQNATADKLRSTSLSNCKQLIIGRHARDVFVHIACDESGAPDTSYLNQAFLRLSRVDGVARANIVSLKLGAD